MTRIFVTGCIGFGLLAAPWALAADGPDAALQRAIQFEQQKEAAAARQAALEAQHSTVQSPAPAIHYDRAGETHVAPKFRTEPTPEELQQALAWEHHKDAAAAAQRAPMTARSSGGTHTTADSGSK